MCKKKEYNLLIETDLSEKEIRKLLKKKDVCVKECEEHFERYLCNILMQCNLECHFGVRQLFKNKKSKKLIKLLDKIFQMSIDDYYMEDIVQIGDLFEGKYMELTEDNDYEYSEY